MFYEQFEKLCKRSGERPYALVRQLGVSSSSIVDQWKKGSVPRQAMLKKIADHFGVTIDYLLTGQEKQLPVSEELSEDEAILLSAFRSLTDDQRRFVLVQLRAAAQAQPDQADPG